jgi:hypothetical protein
MSEITSVHISPDRTKLVIVIDEGERDIVEFDVELIDNVSLVTVPSDYINLGGGR